MCKEKRRILRRLRPWRFSDSDGAVLAHRSRGYLRDDSGNPKAKVNATHRCTACSSRKGKPTERFKKENGEAGCFFLSGNPV